jgi:hypothetical protein
MLHDMREDYRRHEKDFFRPRDANFDRAFAVLLGTILAIALSALLFAVIMRGGTALPGELLPRCY